MAGLPPTNANDGWAPEPELREAPPRPFEEMDGEYPDLNKPSQLLFLGVGAALFVGGIALLFTGLGHHKIALGLLGGLLALGGGALLGMFPVKLRAHRTRAENLISYGVPVMARVLAADNMTGDSTFSRSVKYQVILPGGDMTHRSVNVDERLLPRVIPADVTALVDMQSGDAELYCALPLRAAMRGALAPQQAAYTPRPTATPVTAPATASAFADLPLQDPADVAGGMATLSGGRVSAPPRSTPPPVSIKPEPEPEDNEPPMRPNVKKPGSSSLPWE